MTFAICALTARVHAEHVACGPALAEIFAETQGDSAKQTPPTFKQKKEAILSIYHAATEGLTIKDLQGLMREPFDFKDFKDATNLSRTHEKLIQLKKILPIFSAEEQNDLMSSIQTFLIERISRKKKSQEIWHEKQKEKKDVKLVSVLEGHTDPVDSLAFSPDGTRFVSSEYTQVRIWDLNQSSPTSIRLEANVKIVNSIAFSPDGKLLAVSGEYGIVQILNLEPPPSTPHNVTAGRALGRTAAFSADGHSLASGDKDGAIRIYDLTKQRSGPRRLWRILKFKMNASITFEVSTTKITFVAFLPDGSGLVTADESGIIRLLDLKKPKPTIWNLWGSLNHKPASIILRDHQTRLVSIALSPDGTHIAASGAWDNKIYILNVNDQTTTQVVLEAEDETIYSLAFSNDGTRLAAGALSKKIYILDFTQPGLKPVSFEAHPDIVISVAFSPDGKTLASGSRDKTIRLWQWRKILGLDPEYLEEDAP